MMPTSTKKWGVLVGVVTLVVLLFRNFGFENYQIRSDSMEPTLLNGDWVWVYRSAFSLRLPFSDYTLMRFQPPKVFNLVTFVLPDSNSETYTRRVVALDGDQFEISAGKIILNGERADYDSGDESTHETLSPVTTERLPAGSHSIRLASDDVSNYGPIQVPAGHFFALADNRAGIDSRTWGPIPLTCLRGRPKLIFLSKDPQGSWKWSRFGSMVK